MNKKRAML